MASAVQFSEERAISESQQLSSRGSFPINALKVIVLKTTVLKKSHEKKTKDDLNVFLLLVPLTYTECDSEGRIQQEFAGPTPTK